jgi:hypothetical protein
MSPDLESIAERVVAILVETFDFPETDARHRIALWRAQQHNLEGQVLESLLPLMSPEQRAESLVRWVLEGRRIEAELE